MKKFLYVLIIIVPLLGFGQQYNYGIGIILGYPTGFSGELVWSENSAIVFNAGWSLREDFGLHVTATYQFMFPGVIKGEEGEALNQVVPYLGVGGRMLLEDKEGDSDVHVGLRGGGGIEYLIKRFGLFVELYPVVDIIPETDADFEGGLGFRFYF